MRSGALSHPGPPIACPFPLQAVDRKLLVRWCMGPAALAAAVAGGAGNGASGELPPIPALFRVVVDEELSENGNPLGESLKSKGLLSWCRCFTGWA